MYNIHRVRISFITGAIAPLYLLQLKMNNNIELIELYYNIYEWWLWIFCSFEWKKLEYISIKLLCFQIQIDMYYFRKDKNKNKRSLFRFYK